MSTTLTTATSSTSASRTPTSLLASSVLVVAGRTIKKFVRTPQLIVVGTAQSILFLVIFRYVFGGAVDAGGVPYVDFLVPGFITTTVLFVGTGASIGVAEDIEQGFNDRLRSLPIPRTSILAGRVLADTGLLTWNLVVAAAVSFAVGFRLHGDLGAGLAALALCAVFGFACSWLFITIGLVARTAQAAQGMSLLVFPFTFVSSAYVPIESMPGWLRSFAEHQPVTQMVNAVRALALGNDAEQILSHGASYYIIVSLVWCAVLTAAFAALATARYQRS